MRTLALAAGCLVAITLHAQEPATATETAAQPPVTTAVSHNDPAALVRASKEAKAKGRKSGGKVITNADLKKEPKTATKTPARTAAAEVAKSPAVASQPEAPAAVPAKTTIEREDERYRDKIAATEKLLAAEKKVKELQDELYKVEQSYYDENDPDVRDKEIRRRFVETRRRLEGANRELDGARAALESVTTRP